MTPEQSAFIALVTPGALASERDQRVPAAVTVAQAILESGWGTTRLAVEAKNLFGIKASGGWTGRTVARETQEFVGEHYITVTAHFRAYDDVADSIRDHGEFLQKPRYAPAFLTSTPDDFARQLQLAGYATDPVYAAKLIGLMDTYDLRDIHVESLVPVTVEVEPGTLITAGDQRVYVVKRGDTLWALSRRFGRTVEAIAEANRVTDPGFIEVGQVLWLP